LAAFVNGDDRSSTAAAAVASTENLDSDNICTESI
jgi:hypothetical protein